MKTDLDRANEALAAGRADEALLYAWNALGDIGPEDAHAPALARIALALDDPRLLREIERRGFSASTPPAQEPAWGHVKRKRATLNRKWANPLLRALPLLAVMIVAVSVANITKESGARYPTAKDTTATERLARPILAESSGVWLVPLGESARVNVARLAEELSARYHIPVGTLPGVALPRWTLDESQRALVAEQLIRLLRQAYLAQRSAVVIGITDFEMYARTEELPHTFSWRAPPHYGVVSTSELGTEVFRGDSRHVRTGKLVARNIGFLYLHRREVDDPHSLLRPQMHGVGDIDKLEETL
jgi:hypothetical protein